MSMVFIAATLLLVTSTVPPIVLPSNALSSAILSRCVQNHGNTACTKDELASPYLQLHHAVGFSKHFDLPAMVQSLSSAEPIVGRVWLLNPSIVLYNSSLHLLVRLQIHPTPDSITNMRRCPYSSLARFIPCPPQFNIHVGTINFAAFATLDAHLNVSSPLDVIDHTMMYEDNPGYGSFGAEDSRIFLWGDDVYIVYNERNGMNIQQVYPIMGLRIKLKPEDNRIRNTIEKNWSPIHELTSKTSVLNYLFARYIEPHQIMQCSKTGGI
jgi:hypothetical protein